MVALSLSILALAAGVYLLVKVKSEFLGKPFELLAWLVILLSLVAIGFKGFKMLHHCGHCKQDQCKIEEKQIIIKDGEDGGGHCHMGDMNMESCHMEGDSCVMNQATCEKMMGKDACEKMMKERGRCIMSKEECMKMCPAHSGCMMDSGMHGGCPMEGGKKDCCKKQL